MEFNWKPEFHVTTDQTRIGSNVIWSDVFPIDDRFSWVIHFIPQSPEKEKRGVSDTFVEAIAVAESAMREIATEIEAEQDEFESSKKQIREILDLLAHVEDAELDSLIERFTAIEQPVRPPTPEPKPSFGVAASQLSFSDMAEIWNRDYLQTCLQPGTRQWHREHRGQFQLLRHYGLRLADAIEENLRADSENGERHS